MFHRNTYQEPITFGHVPDGLSNTFLIGEEIPSQFNYSAAFFCNVLVDGSVRFVKQTIAITAYRAISTRNGSEVAQLPE